MKIQRGILYLADLSPNYGTEAGKIRPVLVIQTNLLNDIGHPSTWVLPCTTQLTPSNILRVHLPKEIAGNDKDCDVMIDQSRTIDNRRFQKQLSPLPQSIFREVTEKLKTMGEL